MKLRVRVDYATYRVVFPESMGPKMLGLTTLHTQHLRKLRGSTERF